MPRVCFCFLVYCFNSFLLTVHISSDTSCACSVTNHVNADISRHVVIYILDISGVTLICNMYALLGDISADISATPIGDRHLLSTYIWTYKSLLSPPNPRKWITKDRPKTAPKVDVILPHIHAQKLTESYRLARPKIDGILTARCRFLLSKSCGGIAPQTCVRPRPCMHARTQATCTQHHMHTQQAHAHRRSNHALNLHAQFSQPVGPSAACSHGGRRRQGKR